MSESVGTDKVLSTPIGKFEGCDIFIISAENGETVIQTGKYSEPRPISLEFTESIFTPFVTGKLVIDIPNGILEEGNARITSQDLLIFKLKIPFSLTTDDFIPPIEPSGAFFISSVTQTSSSEKTTTFEMTFMSVEGLNDLTTRIAKSYNKMKRSDIVIDIYDEYIKENAELSQVTDTLHSDFCCVLPNWSPSKCIKWLSTGSMDSGNPECTNFFFFQRFNPDGELETIFTSLDDMIKEPTMGEEGRLESGYIVDILNDEEDPRKENHRERRGILEGKFRIPDINTTEYGGHGTWGGTLYFYDQTRKKYFEKEFNYREDGPEPFVDKNTKKFIEENKAIPETLGAPASYKSMSHKHKFLFHSDEKDEGVDKRELWLDTTLTQKNLNFYKAFEIDIVGDTNRRVGECVTFANMQIKNLTTEEDTITELDKDKKSMGGKYLVTDVVHRFTFSSSGEEDNQYHLTTLTLMRDGNPNGS